MIAPLMSRRGLAERLGRLLPAISETERQALAAGTVWLDGELFSGRPDLRRLAALPYPRLSAEEQAFLDGPVAAVCALVDDREVQRRGELPAAAWELLRREGFFGLTLPREHGGRGFSALAASAVFGKLASRSLGLSALVLIPNSVGPGELLLHHGTPEQQRYWLPLLASGTEIPCFALTETAAGSDAAALTSRGVVERGADGEPWLRLDFDKRYITLAPVATLIGLAFQLEDPAELLGRGPAPGITVALVPVATPGVEVGVHDPLGLAFPNGPVRGRDVRLPASAILGGAAGVGQGWRMVMEALSGGRAISLPAQACAGAKQVARVAGAYAAVREQFGRPIGRFAGVEEKLAAIGGLAYAMEATRAFTCGAVDAGERPAVVSALVKYLQTELMREVAAHGMDVLGGAAIMLGPRNLMARAWIGAPVGITVEGANVLTRTLIAFGQGALRCHPWTQRELAALEGGSGVALVGALLGHAIHFGRNALRATALGLTRGRLARSPVHGPTARHWRRLAWAAARFGVWADVAIVGLGARLKSEGRVAGRLADMLGWMVVATATLRRFAADGEPAADRPLMEWAIAECFHRYQRAFEGVLDNLPLPGLGWLLRGPVSWWARLSPLGRPPADHLGSDVAKLLQTPGEARDRLLAGTFVPEGDEEPLRWLENALVAAHRAQPLLARVRTAMRRGELPPAAPEAALGDAVTAGVLTAAEAASLGALLALREEVVRVDERPLPGATKAPSERDPVAASEAVAPTGPAGTAGATVATAGASALTHEATCVAEAKPATVDSAPAARS
jgi:acyl-CoA dehydrogenase